MKKIIALLLTVILIFSTVSSIAYGAAAKGEKIVSEMDFVAISDPHFYPSSLMSDSAEWKYYCENTTKMFPQSEVFFCVSPIVHQLTHQRIIAQCVKIESAPDSFLKNRQWVSIASLHEYVFPQLLLRILDKILE